MRGLKPRKKLKTYKQTDIATTRPTRRKEKKKYICSKLRHKFEIGATIDNISTLSGLNIKQQHLIVELEFEKYRKPVFSQDVSKKPILSVDIGFSQDDIYLYYRTDSDLHCIILTIDNP